MIRDVARGVHVLGMRHVLLFLLACNIPDLSGLDLSGCIDECNATDNACLQGVNDEGTTCLNTYSGPPADADAGFQYNQGVYTMEREHAQMCAETQTRAGEACGSVMVTCISSCIRTAEDRLKGK